MVGKLLLATLVLLAIGPPEWRWNLSAVAVVLTGAYIAVCAFWDLAPCWWCKGKGRTRGDGQHARRCWWCKGDGRWHTRWGRRAFLRLFGSVRSR